MHPNQQKALDWFLKQTNDSGTQIMKTIEGDVDRRMPITAKTVAAWLALYLKDNTSKIPVPVGRRFRESHDNT